MTLPASSNSASERCLSSAMEANACTDFERRGRIGLRGGDGHADGDDRQRAGEKYCDRDACCPPYALAAACVNGSVNTRCPVSFDHALAIAGAMGGVPGSPMPVGFSFEGTMCTSTSGISLMRSTR